MNTPQPTESQTTTRATPAETTSESDDAESWVARCQRQFDARRTDRLPNFADGTNEVTP